MHETSTREKDHLLSLKVMRLTRPFVKPLLHVHAESNDLPGEYFQSVVKDDVATMKDGENISSSEILSLPQTFGSIYLGETFSCYISILNNSNQNCKDVSIKTDMQTASQRFQVTTSKPRPLLSPDQSVDDVLRYEVKELGTHILICAVSYSSTNNEKLFMRRFYKFQVLKPLEVKTKFYNSQNDVVFLEAQVQNNTASPMCLEQVALEPSNYYHMTTLNQRMGVSDNTPTAPLSGPKGEVFGSTHMNCMDTRQYLFKLTPKPELLKELKAKPLSPIGKIDIVWRTNLGETGRLQTSQLQRTVPAERDVQLTIREAPDVVSLEKQFQIQCRLENSSSSKIEAKLFLTNPQDNSFLWCGVSGKALGPLPPNSYLDIALNIIAVKAGLHSIGGVRILDTNSSKEHQYQNICKILASHNNNDDQQAHFLQ